MLSSKRVDSVEQWDPTSFRDPVLSLVLPTSVNLTDGVQGVGKVEETTVVLGPEIRGPFEVSI